MTTFIHIIAYLVTLMIAGMMVLNARMRKKNGLHSLEGLAWVLVIILVGVGLTWAGSWWLAR